MPTFPLSQAAWNFQVQLHRFHRAYAFNPEIALTMKELGKGSQAEAIKEMDSGVSFEGEEFTIDLAPLTGGSGDCVLLRGRYSEGNVVLSLELTKTSFTDSAEALRVSKIFASAAPLLDQLQHKMQEFVDCHGALQKYLTTLNESGVFKVEIKMEDQTSDAFIGGVAEMFEHLTASVESKSYDNLEFENDAIKLSRVDSST